MNDQRDSALDPLSRKEDVASRLAVLSFASGLVLCCPLAGLVAVLTGALALFQGRGAVQETSWRRYAWGGLSLGVVGTLAGLLGLLVFSHSQAQWEREGRVLFSGPNNALFELSQENHAGFHAEFSGPGATADEEALSVFKDRLANEFGAFLYCNSPEVVKIEGEGPWTIGGYQAVFASVTDPTIRSDFPCEIVVERLPSGTLRLVRFEIRSDDAVIEYPTTLPNEVPQGG
ncbi:MAG: hypothetical protein CBC35_01025 [Planctomycetes bacterium TMED75]|nr:hypothetical protein [Planctomycetaceae bacterium]OUU96386.1 MAG: hypothetical protein CBC35_01025 [Planctomycetes bacterium TMED75]